MASQTDRKQGPGCLSQINLNPIELFAAQYLPHYLKCQVPPFHREIYAALWDVVCGREKRLLIEAPRDFAKSTLTSIIFSLYLICESEHESILSFSRGGKMDLAKKWLGRIKRELEGNNLLKHDFGTTKRMNLSTWDAHHIEYRRKDKHEGDFRAASKGMSARGHRGIIFIDDPQNKDDVESDTILQRDLNWFFEDLMGVLEPDDSLVFIGNRLSPLSLLSVVAELPGWKVLSYGATHNRKPPPEGHSIWPEKWSDKALIERLNEIGLHRFMSEYENQPQVTENPPIQPEWIQSYDPESPDFKKHLSDGLYTVVAIDPAISKRDTADYTALLAVSATFEKEPKFFVRDVREEHWSMKETAEQVFLLFDQYQQHKTIVEEVAYQKALLEEIRDRERVYRKNVNLYPVIPDRDKLRRVYNVQSLFQQGRVFINQNDPRHQRLKQELMMFDGKGKFPDDTVDALVYCLTDLRAWGGERRHEGSHAGVVLSNRPRSAYTGIV